MKTTMFSFQTVGVFTGGTLVHRLREGAPRFHMWACRRPFRTKDRST